MAVYLICMYLASLALGYVLAFTESTHTIGRAISDTDTPTGFQDAITPPRISTFAIVIYIICIGGFIFSFWRFGWLAGIGTTVGFLFVVPLNKVLILPKPDSEHFRNIIIRSMVNRHADFVKSGDMLRASAMAVLLEKLGMPVDDFMVRISKR
jgi:hypothetical protein